MLRELNDPLKIRKFNIFKYTELPERFATFIGINIYFLFFSLIRNNTVVHMRKRKCELPEGNCICRRVYVEVNWLEKL